VSGSIIAWRELSSEFKLIKSLRLEEVDRALKKFWISGAVGSRVFKKHVMHLAHGYSHATCVANLASRIARTTGTATVRNAFVAGLLHDAYRPIETGEGTEKHGEYCARVAEAILRNSGFTKEAIASISQAIEIHELTEEELICKSAKGRTLDNFMKQDLNAILFLADKCHTNIERIMAYAYDCQTYASDKRTPKDIVRKLRSYHPKGHVGALDIALSLAAKKFWRDTIIASGIQERSPVFGPYCRLVFDAWENTFQELHSQSRKEQRGEDSSKTIMLFWAFKEAISNFRYLSVSERFLYGRSGEDLLTFLHDVTGRYQDVFLAELEIEPFGDIMAYRRRYSAKKHLPF
jgi:HD superfamily phosphohydrolase YqeK